MLCFVNATSFAQNKIKHYTTTNGLPHDITYGIFQDSHGFIWIGTDDGLAKFDGNSFDIINANNGLSSNYVIDINELSNKNIVIATWRGGLNIINPKTNTIIQDLDGPSKLSNIEVFQDTVYNTHDNINNYLWLNKNHSIKHSAFKYQQAQHSLIRVNKSNGKSTALQYTSVNDSLFAFTEVNARSIINGIYQIKGKNYNLVFEFLKDYPITAFAKLNNKNYIAASHDIVFIFNKTSLLYKKKLQISDVKISKIISLNDHEFVFLTKDLQGAKYAYKYNIENNELLNLIDFYAIKSTTSDILLDREKNLWITTFGDGVFFIENNENSIETIAIDKNIIDFEFFNKKVYAISNNDLFELKNLTSKQKYSLSGTSKQIKAIDDTLFINIINNKQNFDLNIHNKNIKEQFAYRIFHIESIGTILVGNDIQFLKTKKTCHFNKLEYNIFDAIFYYKKLYFFTNRGLYVYNQDKNNLEKETTINNAIKDCIINASIVKNDTLILGTDKGLWKIHGNSVINYTEKEGLISSRINCLTIDHKNKLWIGTQNGLSVHDGKGFINLNQESGLSSSYVSAIKENEKKEVWISGNRGISILDNSKPIKTQKPPTLLVKNEGLQFSYTAISYNRNEIKTQYKVNDNNWKSLSNKKGTLDFKSYKPATYQVVFRSKKNDSDWAYSKRFSISVKSPWYKKWWLIFIFTSVISSMLILLVLNQLKRIKKRNKTLKIALETQNNLQSELSNVRENIAKDFHDDLGNKLARISMFSDMLSEENLNISQQNNELLEQIHEDSNDIYKGTKDFIFSLKSDSDNLEEVITYLSDFGEDYLKQFNIIFTVEKQIENTIILPYYWSKQIIYIFKEALTNAVKHSECSDIKLRFSFKDDVLEISCIDNGIGFNEEQLNHKNGLYNIKERSKRIGCSLTIISNPNKNTEIRFVGKLH